MNIFNYLFLYQSVQTHGVWFDLVVTKKCGFLCKACHKSLSSIFRDFNVLGIHINENILFTEDRFTSILKFYAYDFVLEKDIQMPLICSNNDNKNGDNNDDKWSIAITIIVIKTKQLLPIQTIQKECGIQCSLWNVSLPSVKTWMEGTYDTSYKNHYFFVTTEPNRSSDLWGFSPKM